MQFVLMAAPTLLVPSELLKYRTRWLGMSERWTAADLADSISMAQQRDAGAVGVNATGDSLYAVVHMPSGRPIAAARTIELKRRSILPDVEAIYRRGIISVLLLTTVLWWFLRRQAAIHAPDTTSTIN